MSMSMSDLRDEWQQHAKNNDKNVSRGHVRLSKWRIEIAVNDWLFLRAGCFCHRVHSNIPSEISKCKRGDYGLATYKNVPPEKQRTQPVDQVKPASPPSVLRPSAWTMAQVTKAPAGAARLKMAR